MDVRILRSTTLTFTMVAANGVATFIFRRNPLALIRLSWLSLVTVLPPAAYTIGLSSYQFFTRKALWER